MNIKTLLLTAGFTLGAIAAPYAQVANISTTAASSFNALNVTTTMQNASATTAFSNDGSTMLVVKSAATPASATLITQATQMYQAGYGYTALTSIPVNVPANTTLLMGPFPQARWNSPQGTVAVSFSTVTGISASAISVAQ